MNDVDLVQGSIIPPLMLLTSFVPGLIIFFLPERSVAWRTTLNLAGAVSKVGLVFFLIPPVVAGARLEWRIPFLPGIDFVLLTDPLALFFVALSSMLWLATTIYAIRYFQDAPNRSRFFGFFSLCVTATVGIALAGNLVTFFVFFEVLTLVTYPLVAHSGTPEALKAGRTYLIYTLTGGVVLLLGVVWLTSLVGPVEFSEGGVQAVADLANENPATAVAIFVALIIGMGVKAAIVPLHGWLPKAMVAPAPVSALLHAVAVVKAGVYGIVRVVDDIYGIEVAADLGVMTPLAIIAAITIIYGSIRALMQDSLKSRLAYSTVSQLSYIVLAIALVDVMATTGGIVHIAHQGIMKITLFFCAGLFAETLGLTKISQLAGVGRRMPVTSAAFTIGALGMIGIPPMAGFVSKWLLGLGALNAGQEWVIWVLVVSTLLNAAYFLPVIYAIWIREPPENTEWQTPPHRQREFFEAPKALVFPTAAVAAFALAAGLFAGWQYSPLSLAEIIAEARYLP